MESVDRSHGAGGPCVCVLALDNADATAMTVAAVAEVTPPPTGVLVVVPPGAELELPAGVADRAKLCVAAGASAGSLVAAAASEARAADPVLVHAGTALADGWLDGLRRAAQEPLVAIAFALPTDGDAVRLAYAPSRPYPRLPSAAGTCAYVTRAALDVIGAPDAELTTVVDVLTDLAQRAILAGLVNVLAADVLFRADPSAMPAAAVLAERYPWLAVANREAQVPASPPARAATRARRALGPLSVTLDCRSFGAMRMGTQTHALGLAAALARTDALTLRVVVVDGLDADVAEVLGAGGHTAVLTHAQASRGVPTTSVVHRPQQVSIVDDLAFLRPLGERLLITQQDLIGYRNPGYHASADDWMRHRRATRQALAVADRVLFFSDHAKADAVAEDLLDPAWADVVGLGVDAPSAARAVGPSGVPDEADEQGFLLCLGADLRHKNLPFAIEVLRELRDDHGWPGHLVLAGPHLQYGSSAREEDELLAADERLRERVTRLGPVTEEEKRWLLERATLVLYPTLDEGFGLLPFEAAMAGTPCAHAAVAALAEILPDATALLVPWDAAASAARIAPLMSDPAARDRIAAAVRHVAERASWEVTAARVVAAYERALAEPRRGVTWEARDHMLEVDALHEQLEALAAFYAAVGEDGARLVGPHALLDEHDRRALLAVAARPALRRPLMAALRFGYRLGRSHEA